MTTSTASSASSRNCSRRQDAEASNFPRLLCGGGERPRKEATCKAANERPSVHPWITSSTTGSPAMLRQDSRFGRRPGVTGRGRIETDSFAITKRWATSAIWKRRAAGERDSTVVSNESSRQRGDSATARACVTKQPRVNCSYSCAVRNCTRTSASSAVGFRTVSPGGALPCARLPVRKFLSSATR